MIDKRLYLHLTKKHVDERFNSKISLVFLEVYHLCARKKVQVRNFLSGGSLHLPPLKKPSEEILKENI